jgi:hypothetical protein
MIGAGPRQLARFTGVMRIVGAVLMDTFPWDIEEAE